MKKILIVILLCALVLTGCGTIHGADVGSNSNGDIFDETQFFIKTVEYQECNVYYIYYRNPDGSETQVTQIGIDETLFHIINGRIYYVQGGSLYSINFSGEDTQILSDSSGENITFDWIDDVEGEWLLCSGTKWHEIYGDPVALDGMHRMPVKTKVKADFSEFYEIE